MRKANLKVLVVDDEPDFLSILAKRIERVTGIPPQTALGGEEALAKICLEVPDVVITDTNMSGMNGVELIRRVRVTYPGIQIFSLFSGLIGSQLTARDIRAMGVVEVMAKVDIGRKLLPKLHSLADGKALLSALSRIFPDPDNGNYLY